MRRAWQVPLQLLLTLCLLAVVPVLGAAPAGAVPGTASVIACEKKFVDDLLMGQFRSFGNTPRTEMHMGIPAANLKKGKVSATQLPWAPGTNSIGFSYIAATDRLWFTVNNAFGTFGGGFSNVTPTLAALGRTLTPASLNALRIQVVNQDVGTTVNLRNVTIDWDPLDADPLTPAVDDFVASPAPAFNVWTVSGLDFSGGFTIRGDIELGGVFGASAGRSNVTFKLGHLTPSAPPSIIAAGGAAVEGSGVGVPLRIASRGVRLAPITVDYTTTDGSAISPADYEAQSGTVTIDACGPNTVFIDTPVVDDGVPEGPERFGFSISNATGGVITEPTAEGTVLDDVSQLGLSISDGSIREGDGGNRAARFHVHLNHAIGTPVAVQLQVTGGTATPGSDFTNVGPVTLVIPAGNTTVSHAISVLGDVLVEGNETVVATLSNAVGASIFKESGTITIVDDEPAATGSRAYVSDYTVVEGDSGTRNAYLTIGLTRPPGGRVFIDWTTVDGTATAGSDYRSQSGRATIAGNRSTAQIGINLLPDTVSEPDEFFDVQLTGITGPALLSADTTGRVTIIDDDLAGAPSNLVAATGTTLGAVDLTWNPPGSTGGEPILDYELRRSTDGGSTFGAWTSTGSTATAFTDTACGAGTSCLYQVRTVTTSGPSDASAPASATGAGVPGAPTDLAAVTGVTTGSVDLSWTAPAATGGQPILDYELRRSTDGGSTFGAWTSTGSTATAFTDAGCGAGTACTYEVRAVTVVGSGAASAQAGATGADVSGAPTGLVATSGDVSGEVDLAWTAPGSTGGQPILDYELRRSTDGGSTFGAWTSTGSTATAFTDTGCGASVSCTYEVRAVTSLGAGAASNQATALGGDLPGAPSSLVAASGDTLGEVELSWSAASGPVVTYEYRRSTDGGTSFGLWSSTGSTTPTFSDVGCGAGTSCTYEVRAVSAVGTGAASNQATATGATVPSAPTALAAAPGTTLSTVDLSWTAPASDGGQPITDYEFRRSTDGGSTFGGWTSTGSTATSHTGAACPAGTSCTFEVRAVTVVGTSAASTQASATGAGLPTAPTGLAGAPGDVLGEVDLSWTAPASTGGQPITHYEYRRSTDGGSTFGAWTTTGSATTTFADTGCGASVSCTYQVRAVTVVGLGAASAQATATGADVASAPTGLAAVTGDVLGEVDLSWAAPAANGGQPVTDYEYRRSTDGGSTFGAWTSTGSTATAFVDTGCGASVSCTYEVRAVTVVGLGAASAQATATGADVASAPVGLVAATGDALGEVDLAWAAPAANGGQPVTDYEFRRSTDGGSTFGAWTSTGSAVTAFTDTGCGAATSCTYEVRAITVVGVGAASGQATATGADVPGAPTTLAAVTGSVTGSVDLTWTAPAANGGQPVTDYEYRVSTDGGTVFGAWTSTGSTSTAFTDPACGASVSCTYEVRAVTVVGAGTASNQSTATGAP